MWPRFSDLRLLSPGADQAEGRLMAGHLVTTPLFKSHSQSLLVPIQLLIISRLEYLLFAKQVLSLTSLSSLTDSFIH